MEDRYLALNDKRITSVSLCREQSAEITTQWKKEKLRHIRL